MFRVTRRGRLVIYYPHAIGFWLGYHYGTYLVRFNRSTLVPLGEGRRETESARARRGRSGQGAGASGQAPRAPSHEPGRGGDGVAFRVFYLYYPLELSSISRQTRRCRRSRSETHVSMYSGFTLQLHIPHMPLSAWLHVFWLRLGRGVPRGACAERGV